MANELMIELPKANALQVFTDQGGIDPYIDKIRKEALSLVPDLSTKTGRAAIASMAAKIARSKTYLDEAGRNLCDQERAKIDKTLKAVLDSRKMIRTTLDDLRDEVRKPLTDWEDAEADRKAKIESRIEAMKRLIKIGSDAAAIEKHLKRLERTEIDETFGEYTAEAAIARTHAIRNCQDRLDAQVKIENDLKELEELRIKNAAQEQKDREAIIAEHAAYLATQEALHRENLAKQQAIDKENAEKARKENAEAEENARIADAEYRQRVIEETIQSFVNCGFDERMSTMIVQAIDDGNIKNVFIKF